MKSVESASPGAGPASGGGPVLGWAVLGGLALAACAALGLAWWLDARRAAAAPARPEDLALRLDLNRASAAELELLPGVGPTRAARLVESRRQRGGFTRLVELDDPGLLGPGAAERLAPYLLPLPAEAPAAAGAAPSGEARR